MCFEETIEERAQIEFQQMQDIPNLLENISNRLELISDNDFNLVYQQIEKARINIECLLQEGKDAYIKRYLKS